MLTTLDYEQLALPDQITKKVSKNQQRKLILIAGNKLANEQFRLKFYILDNIIYLLFIHLLIL